MKRLLYSVCGAALFLSGCNLMEDFRLNTTKNYLGDISLMEFLTANRDTTLTLFREALHYTGLAEELNTGKKYTVLMPSNTAMRNLLASAGCERTKDFHSGVLSDLLKYAFIEGTYISYEMELGVNARVSTLSGNRMYFQRLLSGTDSYSLAINSTPSDTEDSLFTSPRLVVRQQDMMFRDHVACIVEALPQFRVHIQGTDVPPEVEGGESVKLPVAWDTYINHNTNSAYYDVATVGTSYRPGSMSTTPVFMYALQDVPFYSTMRRATLNLYFTAVVSVGPQTPEYFEVFDLNDVPGRPVNFRSITRLSWRPNGIYPLFHASAVKSSAQVPARASVNTWISGDITDVFRSRYDQGADSIVLSVRPNIMHNNGGYNFGGLREATGTENNPSYILIVNSTQSPLSLDTNEPLSCPSAGSALITKDVLAMSAPSTDELAYTDNNIIYTIDTPPSDGVLTLMGMPLLTGTFTQEAVKAGMVRYFNTGNASSDSFVLTAEDYTGAIYSERIGGDLQQLKITVPVVLQ